ncbi:MAG: hypothetical protein LBS62_10360 [Clostridiales bacterium]|jgi:flagellar basal-body rod modification protein FlgD|nr:hypothetical protein [Clostridiales bacterium]
MASTVGFDYQAYLLEKSQGASTATSAARAVGTDLDKDAFLQLLITQLQYQDPLNPMDDKSFVAQMAQFTALEQMQNMNQSLSSSSAFSMIGKIVSADYYDETTAQYTSVYGPVSAVKVVSGEAYLLVDGKEIPAGKVTEVLSDTMNNLNNSIVAQQNVALLGKYIQAITIDSEGNAGEFVEGKVDYVKFASDGTPILVVGEKEVYSYEVQAVSEDNGVTLIGKEIGYETLDEEGETVIATGLIENINIKDNVAYLVVDGQEFALDKINYVTDALNLIGKNITYGTITGEVKSINIRDGIPYLVLDKRELSFKMYKGL